MDEVQNPVSLSANETVVTFPFSPEDKFDINNSLHFVSRVYIELLLIMRYCVQKKISLSA
jgi:hypothetical protein